MDRAITDDDREIARAGYLPQFHRGLGRFTAFAAGFSYLSILTGVVQNFYLGYREAGPAAIWTWPIVFDPNDDLAFRYNLVGKPTTLVLDQHGRIAWQHAGKIGTRPIAQVLDALLQA